MSPATLTGPAAAAGRRRRAPRGGACDEPPRLFGDEPTLAAEPGAGLVSPLPAGAPASAPAAAPATFADLMADAWAALASGTSACVACGAPVRPRWSATAVVGGRCDGCGTTIE